MTVISAVICTRNRGDSIVKTIETILANDYAAFEIIVVDQSESQLTEIAVRHLFQDARVQYIRTATIGLARGQNIGIGLAHSELIATTDDDCRASSNWLSATVSAFERDPRIGMVLGNVYPAPHDHSLGFVQSYIRREPFLARNIRDKHCAEGIGASMAFRRSLWEELNGFDEMLGSGTQLKAAEETDFVMRTLLNGYFVYETPSVWVTHYGFRTWEEGKKLIHGYILGLTAMYVKHFKCGNWGVLFPFLHLVWRWGFGEPVVNFEHIPSRWLRFRGFIQGLRDGILVPVDRVKCQYVERDRDFAK